MKKALLIAALSLTIATSVISGTLAAYNAQVDLQEDQIVAKGFALESAKSLSWGTGVAKIAPGENHEIAFTVSNFNDAMVTETGMKVDILIDVNGLNDTNTNSIDPLKYSLYEIDGSEERLISTQSFIDPSNDVEDEIKHSFNFTDSGSQQTKNFKLLVEWPSGSAETDNEFIGAEHGNDIQIIVNGSQILSGN